MGLVLKIRQAGPTINISASKNYITLVSPVVLDPRGVPKGGTTGQQLAKKSATDYDTEWVDPDVSAGNAHVIKDEGVSLAQRLSINFKGDAVQATDNEAENSTDVTINHQDLSGKENVGVAQSLVDTHEANNNNPHNVTAAQAGADPAGSAQNVQNNVDAHEVNNNNPHNVTAAQAGADPSGSALAVQNNLNTHSSDTQNPHNVTRLQISAAPQSHVDDTGNPHNVTAEQIGAVNMVKALYAANPGYTFVVSGTSNGDDPPTPSTQTQSRIDWFNLTCGIPTSNILWNIISASTQFVVSSMSVGVTMDQITLTFKGGTFVVNSLSSNVVVDGITLTKQTFVIDDSTVITAIDGITLSQTGTLTPNNMVSSTIIDGIVLSFTGGSLVVANQSVSTVMDNLTITQPTAGPSFTESFENISHAIALNGSAATSTGDSGYILDTEAGSDAVFLATNINGPNTGNIHVKSILNDYDNGRTGMEFLNVTENAGTLTLYSKASAPTSGVNLKILIDGTLYDSQIIDLTTSYQQFTFTGVRALSNEKLTIRLEKWTYVNIYIDDVEWTDD